MIWPFIIISYASLFVFGLTENIRGPLFPEVLKQFGVSNSLGSMMYVLSSISGLITSFGCRHLLRKYNRLIVLQSGCLGLIIALLGLAFAPNFSVFLGSSVLFGLSMGVIGLIPNILVPLGTTPATKQRMLAGLHTMYGVASLISPMFAALIQTSGGNWRTTFAFAAIGPLSLLIYSLSASHRNLHTVKIVSKEDYKLNRSKNIKPQLYLALMLSFTVAAELMVSTRLALYMQQVHNYSMEHASIYVSYFFVAMMAGRFLFTVVPFKTSAPRLLQISLVLTALFFGLGFYVHPLFLALTGFSVAPFYPLAISWISSEFPEDIDTAVTYMMSMDAVMLITMQIGIGKLTDLLGIESALKIGTIFLPLSFLILSTYSLVFKKKKQIS